MKPQIWFTVFLSIALFSRVGIGQAVAIPESVRDPVGVLGENPETSGRGDLTSEKGHRQAEPAERRWLLLCCGLPGDQDHRDKMTRAMQQIANAAPSVLGISKTDIHILAGDQVMVEELQPMAVEICTKENLTKAFSELNDQVQAKDCVWIVVIGHGHVYSGRSTFNIQGPDVDANEFSRWAKALPTERRISVLTIPTSGYWLQPMRGPAAITIAATDAGSEITGTEMPYVLGEIMAGESKNPLRDYDGDTKVTLSDLYLAMAMEVGNRFNRLERLMTEHCQIDDNGDGAGSEIQDAYIEAIADNDEGDESHAAKLTEKLDRLRTRNGEGAAAREVELTPPSKPEQDDAAGKKVDAI